MIDCYFDDINRRDFLKLTGAACLASLLGPGPALAENPSRPNILFLTADDMNWDSVGVFGCQIPGVTPNLDKLASQGMRFSRAHVPIALCQPCRAAMLTGRYPHNNGATGFQPIRPEVGTLGEALDAAGYWNGVIGKGRHYQPSEKFHWHFFIEAAELGDGRDPDRYYQYARQFIAKAKETGKPFFLHANAHDPHRPFDLEDGVSGRPFTRRFKPEDIVVPGFLPDISLVRKEVASYFNGVHRADETVGMVLQALAESGLDRSTIALFLSVSS